MCVCVCVCVRESLGAALKYRSRLGCVSPLVAKIRIKREIRRVKRLYFVELIKYTCGTRALFLFVVQLKTIIHPVAEIYHGSGYLYHVFRILLLYSTGAN